MSRSPGVGKAEEPNGLALVRRHGLWVLAALAALPSLDLIALVKGAEAAKHATRLTPGDLVLAALAACAAIEILRFRVASGSSGEVTRRGRGPVPPALKEAVAPLPAFAWVAVAAVAAVAASFGREGVQWKAAVKEVVQLVEILIVGYG